MPYMTPMAPTEDVVESGPFKGDREQRHPAFGAMKVVRWTSSKPERLAGSELGHRSGITVTVSTAFIKRRHGMDISCSDQDVVEFSMSESQWARFVASVGQGEGVPVTLRMRQDGPARELPPIAAPQATPRERHGLDLKEGLDEAVDGLRDRIRQLGEMIEGGRIGKKELRELQHDMAVIAGNLPDNAKYAMDCFVKSSERVVDEIKTEVDAYVDGVARHIGMERLREMAPSLAGAQRPAQDLLGGDVEQG